MPKGYGRIIQKCDQYGIVECPICGKRFVRNRLSIYKVKIRQNVIYLCSWTCYNKALKLYNIKLNIGH